MSRKTADPMERMLVLFRDLKDDAERRAVLAAMKVFGGEPTTQPKPARPPKPKAQMAEAPNGN